MAPSSVTSSVLSSERETRATDETPVDVETVPEPGNTLSPNLNRLDEQPAFDGEIVDALPPDAEPDQYCPDHRPWGTSLSCTGCKIARLNHEAWERRNPARSLNHLRVGIGPASRKVAAGMALAARLANRTEFP